ncbi:MAG: hypothetical protein ACREBR_02435, partial [bacterium]
VIDQFSDQEYKRILFKAMPLEWQRGFTLAGNKVQNTDLLTLEEYMVEVEGILDDRKVGSKKIKDKKSDGSSKTDSNDSQKKKKRQTKPKKTNSSSGKQRRNRLDNAEECPIHGGHKWGKCFENRFGDNYKPPAASSSSSSDKEKKQRQRARKIPMPFNQLTKATRRPQTTTYARSVSLRKTKNRLIFISSTQKRKWKQKIYYRVTLKKTTFAPLQVDLLTKTIEITPTALDLRKERELRRKETRDLTPETLMTVRRIGDIIIRKHFNALIDSGASVCMIAQSCLPKGIPQWQTSSLSFQTTNVTMKRVLWFI